VNPPWALIAGPQKLDTLYDCFMTTMSNVSPYIKTFCMPAALRAGFR